MATFHATGPRADRPLSASLSRDLPGRLAPMPVIQHPQATALQQAWPATSTPISFWNTPKLWDGLQCLKQVGDAPQAAREPRRHAAQDVLWLLFRPPAFGGCGVVNGIPLSGGHGEVERQRHDQDEPGQPVRVADLAVL